MDEEQKEPTPVENDPKESGFAKRMQDIEGVIIIKAKDVVTKKDSVE